MHIAKTTPAATKALPAGRLPLPRSLSAFHSLNRILSIFPNKTDRFANKVETAEQPGNRWSADFSTGEKKNN